MFQLSDKNKKKWKGKIEDSPVPQFHKPETSNVLNFFSNSATRFPRILQINDKYIIVVFKRETNLIQKDIFYVILFGMYNKRV